MKARQKSRSAQRQALRVASFSLAQVFLVAIAVAAAAFLCMSGRNFQVRAQISTDQAASAISILLKPIQASACDGEQLEIKCNDDYVIEIITSELTILARETHTYLEDQEQAQAQAQEAPGKHDNKVTSNSGSGNSTLSGSANDAAKNDDSKAATTTTTTKTTFDTRTNPGNQVQVAPAAAAAADQQQPGSSNAICPPIKSATGANYLRAPVGASAGSAAASAACSEQRAHELSLDSQEKVLYLIKKQCSLLNSCSLDLTASSGGGGNLLDSKNATPSASAAAANSSATQLLGQLLAPSNERLCPRNRKLLELAYKCRPTRVKSRSVCRSAKLQLECSDTGKRLAIGSAVYGYWPEDKKTNERCLQDEQRNLSNSRVQLYGGTCSTGNSTAPLAVIAAECLFKRQCQVSLNRQHMLGLFNESASCRADNNLTSQLTPSGGGSSSSSSSVSPAAAAHYLEYLKVVYVCVSEEFLVTKNSSFLLSQIQPVVVISDSQNVTGSRSNKSDNPPSLLFVSPDVRSSSLNKDQPHQVPFISPPTTVATAATGGQHFDPVNPPASRTAFSTAAGSGPQVVQANEIQPEETPADRVYPFVPNDKHPSNWTAAQRVKFVLLRYQSALILFAVITITISTLLAFLTRLVCSGARNSASSSSGLPAPSRNLSSAGGQKSKFGGNSGGGGKGSSSSASSSTSSASSGSSSSNYTSQTNCTSTVASQQLFLGAGLNQHLHHLNNDINNNNNNNSDNHHHLFTTNLYSKAPALVHQQQQQQQVAASRAPTNSCSESCFSLDEFNNQQHNQNHHHNHHQHHNQQQQQQQIIKQVAFQDSSLTPPALHYQQQHHTTNTAGSDSPALQSNQTTPPCDQSSLTNMNINAIGATTYAQEATNAIQLAGGTTAAAAPARPKLWSFYGSEQHSNSLRMNSNPNASGAHHLQQQQQQQHHGVAQGALAATLRPQRTFMGALQQPAPARNFQCLQQQQPQPQPQPPQLQLGLEQHQSDYLLAMAQVGQHHHLQHSLDSEPRVCQAAGDDQQLQAGQLHLLTLNPVDLQHATATLASATSQCAFHSQQQQQMFTSNTGTLTSQHSTHFELSQQHPHR